MEMQNGAASMEKSMEVLQKNKNRTIIWSHSHTFDVYPKE